MREQKDGKNVNATKELLAIGRAMKFNIEKMRDLLFEIVET